MGQYYRAYVKCGETEKIFDPMDYGSYYKLMEHSWIFNDFVCIVAGELAHSPKEVAWIGDYAEIDDFMELSDYACKNAESILNRCWEQDNTVRQSDSNKIILVGGYLVNHTKKIYIDMQEYLIANTEDFWCINPLPLLTAIGNERGLGDYRGLSMEKVGSWAFDLISWETEIPTTYAKEMIYFKE